MFDLPHFISTHALPASPKSQYIFYSSKQVKRDTGKINPFQPMQHLLLNYVGILLIHGEAGHHICFLGQDRQSPHPISNNSTECKIATSSQNTPKTPTQHVWRRECPSETKWSQNCLQELQGWPLA